MEEQHPIPQQISSYQFRLVGDMTIKQFFQVAGGTLISLVIYSSSLPGLIKWPLIIIFFSFGIALAFFPIGDRPLSKWIVLFLKAIYSPTIYTWQKSQKKISYFQPESQSVVQDLKAKEPIQQALEPSLPREQEVGSLEKKELEFLSKISKSLEEQAPTWQIPGKANVLPFEKSVRKEGGPPQTIQSPTTSTLGVTPLTSEQKVYVAQAAKFSLDASPPSPPTKPNIVVGQVINPEGKIVEGAILEIRDSEGRPVRALKTNKLGHFIIVTPLVNGNYEIITEKEGLEFDPILIEAVGKIIPPIAIRAKKNISKS